MTISVLRCGSDVVGAHCSDAGLSTKCGGVSDSGARVWEVNGTDVFNFSKSSMMAINTSSTTLIYPSATVETPECLEGHLSSS
jgi:hypothetical protein